MQTFLWNRKTKYLPMTVSKHMFVPELLCKINRYILHVETVYRCLMGHGQVGAREVASCNALTLIRMFGNVQCSVVLDSNVAGDYILMNSRHHIVVIF